MYGIFVKTGRSDTTLVKETESTCLKPELYGDRDSPLIETYY